MSLHAPLLLEALLVEELLLEALVLDELLDVPAPPHPATVAAALNAPSILRRDKLKVLNEL